MMEKSERIEREWRVCVARMKQGAFFRDLEEGRITLAHYSGFLRESYYNTAENPSIMALFVAHLKSDNHRLVAKFLRHTAMETGHHDMALADLKILGEDPAAVVSGRPLPATEAMGAFIIHQIQHRNPLAYLGYSYHLEAIAVGMGSDVMGRLGGLGIPAGALTFLSEHAEADPVHMQWNRDYVESFVRSEDDMQAVLHGLRGTCALHGLMFQGIRERVLAPEDWSPGGTTSLPDDGRGNAAGRESSLRPVAAAPAGD